MSATVASLASLTSGVSISGGRVHFSQCQALPNCVDCKFVTCFFGHPLGNLFPFALRHVFSESVKSLRGLVDHSSSLPSTSSFLCHSFSCGSSFFGSPLTISCLNVFSTSTRLSNSSLLISPSLSASNRSANSSSKSKLGTFVLKLSLNSPLVTLPSELIVEGS